jgi:hypothetical protein
MLCMSKDTAEGRTEDFPLPMSLLPSSAHLPTLDLPTFGRLPHFFGYSNAPVDAGGAAALAHLAANYTMGGSESLTCAARGNAFKCVQDSTSPLWEKRLPFFVSYFMGCSGLSSLLGLRYSLYGATDSTEADGQKEADVGNTSRKIRRAAS